MTDYTLWVKCIQIWMIFVFKLCYFLENDYATFYLITFWLLCDFVCVCVILGNMLPSEETNREAEYSYWTSKCMVLT
jgi:hypothetical protein